MKTTRPTRRVGQYSQGSAPWTTKKRSKKLRRTYPDNWDDIKRQVKIRDKFQCCKCHRGVAQLRELGLFLEVDHIIRLADGGTNAQSNLQCLCTECHENRLNHRHLRVRK